MSPTRIDPSDPSTWAVRPLPAPFALTLADYLALPPHRRAEVDRLVRELRERETDPKGRTWGAA
jgi:hypothetical protein